VADVFISYARSTADQAQKIADALRNLGFGVWRDDELPAHRDYSEVIEERLRSAKAVVVVWSAEAVKSQWVRAEADLAREAGTLVQLNLDGAPLPMPFNRIQYADLAGWTGDVQASGWKKVAASVAELVGANAALAPQVGDPTPLPSKPSIAVMPFANLSGDPDQEYFADGMTIEVTAALARFPTLFVIASATSLSYRGDGRGPAQIARELGVRYLLIGSVRRSGQRVRIAVEMLDVASNTQIWSDRFDGAMDDVFDLQDAVAHAVAGRVAPAITTAEVHRTDARPTSDLAAYELYLRATRSSQRWERDAIPEAIGLLQRAVERDPTYATALAFLAFCHGQLALYREADAKRHRQAAIELGGRALKANPDDPDVLNYLAITTLLTGGDVEAADRMIERSLATNPGFATAWLNSGWIKLCRNRAELALEHLQKAARIDPRSGWRPNILHGVGTCLMALDRAEEAIAPLAEAVELAPDMGAPSAALAAALALAGRVAEARAALQAARGIPLQASFEVFRESEAARKLRTGLALAGVEV
jgi:adenylate cyclase